MSTTIDEKIVEMRFDNKDFEKNVKTSMNTLEAFKKDLNFDGAKSSLDNLQKTTKGMKFGALGDAVDTIKNRFSALEVIGVTALANIANSAVDTGKRIVKSLTVEPIKQGFDEYELKMGSVQTIMASTGADIKTVNGYLDELNTYADKTIYSFSDMTASIGKFTNAGVSLDNAVKAIQGISNEAAVSGANAQEASRAMYNFAQALSAGSVKLLDWKSIENANMATVEFKQSLLDTAVAMGTVVKVGDDYKSTTVDNNGHTSELFNTTKGFNDALSSQWMTTEVLVQTLSNYSTDIREMSKEEKKAYEEKLKSIGYTEEQIQAIEKLGQKAFDAAQDVKSFTQLMDTLKEGVGSGWSQTFEIIFGDLEEAKNLWSSVYKELGGIIDNASKSRNEILKTWDELGGRKALFEGIANIWNSIKNILLAAKQGFRDVIPPMTGKRLAEITNNFKEFTERLNKYFNSSTAWHKALRRIEIVFRGIGYALDIVKQMAAALFKGASRLFGIFTKLSGNGFKIIAILVNGIRALDEWLKKTNLFEKVINGTIDGIIYLGKTIDSFVKDVTGYHIGELFDNFIDGLLHIKDNETIKKIWSTIVNIYTTAAEKIKSAVETIKKYIKSSGDVDTSGASNLSDKLKKIFAPIMVLFEGIKKLVGVMFKVIKAVMPLVKSLITGIGNLLSNIASSIGDIFKNTSTLDLVEGGLLVVFFKKIFTWIKSLSDGAKEGKGILSSIKDMVNNVAGVIGSIKGVLDGVKESMETWQKDIKANIILKIAAAIGILTVSLLILSTIDNDKLTTALGSLTVMFIQLITAMKSLTSTTSGVSMKSMAAIMGLMISMSTSILLLAVAVKMLAKLDPNQVVAGVSAIMSLIVTMTIVAKKMSSNSKQMTEGISGLISFSIAILILAKAVKSIAKLKPEELIRGLGGVGAILLELALFFKLLGKNKPEKLMSFGAGLIAIAYALRVMVKAVAKLGEMDTTALIKGVSAIGVLLGELAIFFKIIGDKPAKMISFGVGMVLLASALTILTSSIEKLGSLGLEKVAVGLIGLAGAMGIMVTAVTLLSNIKGLGKMALSLVVISTAIVLLASAIKILGTMDIIETITSLIGLAGAMTIMVTAISMLSNVKGLIKSALAISVFANAILVLSIAMKILGTMNFEQMITGLTGLAGAIAIMVLAMKSLDSVAALKAALAIQVFSAALLILAPALKILGSMSFGEILGSLVMLAGVFVILGAAAVALGPVAPAILALSKAIVVLGAGVALLGGGLFLLASGLTIIAVSADAFIGALIRIIEGLLSLIPSFFEAIGKAILEFLATISALLPEVGTFLTELLKMVFKVLREVVPDLVETLLTILEEVIGSLTRHIPGLVRNLIDFLAALIVELGRGIGKIVNALLDFVLDLIDSLGKSLYSHADKIVDMIFGLLIDVMKSALKMLLPFLHDWIFGNDEVTKSIEVLSEAQRANIEKSMEMAKAYRDLRDARNESFKDISSEYQYIEDLKNEYNSLIDDNGKIKTGYEERANTIKTTLADAMGVELSEIDKLIDANGRLGKSFDEVIQKMQAEALLEANKDAYQTAVKNRDEAIRQYASAGRTLAEVQKQLDDANAKEAAIMDTYNNMLVQDADAAKKYLESQQGFFEYHDKLKEEVGNAAIAYRNAAEAYSGTMQEISNTQTLMAAVSSGNAEDIKKAMELLEHSFITAENGTKETLKQQIRDYEGYYNDLKDALDRGENGVTDEMVLAAQSRLGKAKGELAKFEQAHYESGKTADKKQAEGIKKNSDVVSGAAVAVISSAKAAADKEAKTFVGTGENVGAGTAQGIIDSIKKVGDAVDAMMKTAKNKADKALDSHSPSKEFEKRGKYMGQGLVNGLEAYSGEVSKASYNLAETSLKSAENALSYIDDYLNSDITYEPNIKPIVDLSNVNHSAGIVDGLFNSSKSINLAANAGYSTSMMKASRDMTTVNGKTVTSSIDLLHKDIQNLESKMASLKIFMDTGALVGQLVDPMDSAIGNKAYLVERGV